MTDQTRKAEQFRGLHAPGRPLILFNIWDAGGAKAIATGSWSVANANGFADGELLPLRLAIDNLRRIVDATNLPVTGARRLQIGRTSVHHRWHRSRNKDRGQQHKRLGSGFHRYRS
jgi:hypothetical protein